MKLMRFCLMAITSCAIAGSAIAQTADDIIQKHVTAIGGADNWKKVHTMRMSCSANAQGMDIPVTLYREQGKGFRVEYTVNGMTGYSVVTDKGGWNYNPFGGQTKAEAMPEDLVKKSQDQLDIAGPLIDYKAKGNTVSLLGKDDVEGTDCYKLKVTFANGKEETVYIDANTFYQIRTVEKATINGKEIEQTANFGNFEKTPEGIMFPMSIDQGMGTMTVKNVEINKPLAANVFKPADAEVKK